MKSFPEWDFTLPKYIQLCKSFMEFGYKPITVAHFLSQRNGFEGEYTVVLRHDVDRRPFNALKMAQVEANLGIKSTYYFRTKAHTFKADIVQQVAQLGHEIGYHYENLSDMRGNVELAIQDFENNLRELRKFFPIKTICMHGRPLSKWDNRDLWKKYSYKGFGLIGEPYLSIDYKNSVYVSDTGRTWSSNRFNIRDRVSSSVTIEIDSTMELISVLRRKEYKTFFIQCHPERWADHIMNYLFSFCFDKLTNATKRIVKTMRHVR